MIIKGKPCLDPLPVWLEKLFIAICLDTTPLGVGTPMLAMITLIRKFHHCFQCDLRGFNITIEILLI